MNKISLILRVLTVVLVVCVASSYCAAENNDYQYSGWSAGLGTGVLFFETDEEFNSSLIIEAKGGYDLSDSLTLEGGFGYLPYMDSRSSSQKDPKTWHLSSSMGLRGAVDLIYHLDSNPDRKWDPNLGLTGGVMYFSNSLEDGDHFDAFGGLGGGLAYMLNRNWLVRADYRAVVAGHDTEINHHALVSLGYKWGCKSSSSEASTERGADMVQGDKLKTVYFDYDKSSLTPETQEKLKENSSYLKENEDAKVTIEGHCDERGTNEYNYALGERRASSVKDYLQVLGVEQERLNTVSYGEDRPADPEHTKEAWSLNRRVETIVQDE